MVARLITFTAAMCLAFFSALEIFHLHRKTTLKAHLDQVKEYHLHACGRAIAAIANFSAAARSKTIRQLSTPEHIQSTLNHLENSIQQHYQKFYLIQTGTCRDHSSRKVVAKIRPKGPAQTKPDVANFSYRITTETF